AGFFRRSDNPARADVVQEMLGSMDRGRLCPPEIVSFPRFGLELGWLSSPRPADACVSVSNERKDVFLLFAGEHFSDDEAIRPSASGEKVDNICTGTRLLSLYEELGSDLWTKLNGYFSGIIVDIRKGIVVLFNDRYGLGRIYYY